MTNRAKIAALLIAWTTSLSGQSILNVAGGGSDDARPATSISLNQPPSVAADSAGNLYIVERLSHRIRKVSAATGIISTLAGNGSEGFSGDGGPAAEATLNEPSSVALDAAGNVFVADRGNFRIRRVDARTQIITTVVGNGFGFAGDGGPASQAKFGTNISSIAFSQTGDLYIVDAGNDRVRRVSAGVINTVAGSGFGFSGDGGPATAATLRLSGPTETSKFVSRPNVALDRAGNIYVADLYNHRVRKIDANGIITTFAGNGGVQFAGDGGPAVAAGLEEPSGIVADADGNVFISQSRVGRIRRVSAATGIIATFAGSGNGFSGDGGPASAARFFGVAGLTFHPSGDLLVADHDNDRIRRIAASTNIISTVAGGGSFVGDGGVATAAILSSPTALAFDRSGGVIIADFLGDRVRRVGSDGRIVTLAGTGQRGFSGDGGAATSALMFAPGAVATDSAGNVFFSDQGNNRVRRIAAGSGIITTVAGSSSRGFAGDGGPASSSLLNFTNDDPSAGRRRGHPSGLAFDSRGDLYIADTFNFRIRKISASTQIITTVAGNGTTGFSGDGGPATAAQFDDPSGLAIDRNDLYVADSSNHRIRKIDLLTGIITTVAGSGPTGGRSAAGFGGDGGPATAARLAEPTGVATDAAGNLYIADKLNARIRKVSSGIITTIAGQGRTESGFTGDGGPALRTRLTEVHGVAVDSRGNVYIADSDANRIRAVFGCVNVGAPPLTAPNNGSTNVSTAPTLTWDRVEGAFRYDVYLSAANSPALIATDLTATAFTPANLIASTTYFWRVVAKGDGFCVPPSTASSETRSFSVISTCNPPGNFSLTQPADGASGVGGQSVQLVWQSAPGANIYDLYFGPANPPPLLAGGLSSTSFNVSNLSASTSYFWSVIAHSSCDPSKVTAAPTRSFRTAGVCAAAAPFSQRSPGDGAIGVPVTTTLEWTPSANASSYDLYLGTTSSPAAYLFDVRSTAVTVSGLIPSTRYFFRVVAKVACDPARSQTTPTSSFVTGGLCPSPAASEITFVPPGNVGVGQTYTVAWTEAPGLDADGGYIVERSLNPSFSQLVDTQETFSTSASFVSSSAGTYYHRVRALPGCNRLSSGSLSTARTVNVVTGTANVIFTVQPQATVTSLGDILEDKRGRFTLENIGRDTLQVIVGKGEISSLPFFTITDPSGEDAVFVRLEPRKPKSFEIRFSGPPNDSAATYQGIIFVAATGQGLAITPYAFVNLKVGGAPAARPVFLSNGRQTEYTFFPGFGGDDTNRPPITIDIRNDGTAPMELGAEIGPEVWLVPESGWNKTPIAPGATRPVRLFSQRNRAPNGSALPRYTYFTVRTRNGETARLLVQDNDALPTAAGRTSLLEPGSRSYVVPGIISGTLPNGGSTFSRLRLTNVGSEAVQADLFFTPAGADGFDGASVKRATVLIPPNDAVTLTDPLVQVFGLTPPVGGQIEVRAALDRVGFLIVSPSVASPSASGGAYIYQLPTFRLGEGARVGSSHLVSGVSVGPGLRTTLTVTETSGTDRASVRAALVDSQGNRRGETVLDLPRYGQRSVDVSTLTGGGNIDGARIELTVESGGGSVGGLVTMLDSDLNGGASAVSEPSSGTASTSAFSRRGVRALGGNNAAPAIAIVPVVIRGPSPANPNVILKTAVGFSISGPNSTRAVVIYRPSTPGAAPIERTIDVSPRLVLMFDDVLAQLFGLQSAGRLDGSIFIRDLPGAQVFGRLLSSTGGGASKVVASLPLFSNVSEVLSSLQSSKPLYLDGLEQSVDGSRGTRWAVRINETSGASGTVRLRLYEAGNRSQPIAEKSFAIASNGQLELDTVFGMLDLDNAERRKDRTNVLCVATVESGAAVISAVGVATDNRTGDIKHVVFSPNGGVPATGVLKISLVTAKTATPTPAPPTAGPRRRGVRH